MKCLSLIIELEKSALNFEKELLTAFHALGRFPEIDIDNKGDGQLRYNFFTEDCSLLWAELNNGLFTGHALSDWLNQTCVVVCEGDSSEDLLIKHYDPSEQLDSF